jgi:GNAT superfamily N-acetyltransferase
MTYRIREVDGFEDDIAEEIHVLHDLTSNFPPIDPSDLETGHWWICRAHGEPVAYAGVIPSTHYPATGYFKRVGVVPAHRGNGLQLRLMRAIEAKAKRNGWVGIVSDTTDGTHSANNFIRAGYRLFDPAFPWAFSNSLYWRKAL